MTMQKKTGLSHNLQLAFGVAISALLIVGAISYRSLGISGENYEWVRHTHAVLENLQDLRSAVQDLESSYRGFVITGNEQSLKPYRDSIIRLQQDETNIRQLTVDNPVQRNQIPALESLANQKIQFAETVIALRRTKGLSAATDAIRAGESQRVMDQYRSVVQAMQDQELHLLALRDADSARHLGQVRSFLFLGTLMGLLIAFAAVWTVQRDVYQRGLGDEALRESEEKYRLLIQGVQDYGIVMLGPQGECISWNPGAEQMTGYTFEEIAGRNFSRFFSPEDVKRGRPEEILLTADANGLYEEQSMRVRKDGSSFPARSTFTALRAPSGNLRGFSLVSRDLSESKESGAKYRGLLEAAPDAMVVVNEDGDIVLLNLQAEKQFGYSRDELVGQKVKSIIPKGFAERLIADGRSALASN
jgi:PAS domain S-box-containing protein